MQKCEQQIQVYVGLQMKLRLGPRPTVPRINALTRSMNNLVESHSETFAVFQ